MLRSIEGIFKNGKVELLEPAPIQSETRVLVTFLERGQIDLRQRAIDEAQAADLRSRLKSAAEDWNRPEMDVYDEL
jgi:hypothetical protein